MVKPNRILLLGHLGELANAFETAEGGPVYAVEPTLSLEGALERMAMRHFDLVIADTALAPDGATNLLRSLLAMQPQAKIILLSPPAPPEDVIEAMNEHAFSFFPRPFDLLSIRDMIRKAVEIPEWDDGIVILSSDPNYLTLLMRCRLTTAERLYQFLLAMKSGMKDEEKAQIAAAFREMLLNAIEHGGKFNPMEEVRVSRVRTERALVYHIHDPGPGFNRENLPHAAISNPTTDPLAHMKIRAKEGLRAGGFGLLVTKELVDEVIYNQRGNEVILIKHLD